MTFKRLIFVSCLAAGFATNSFADDVTPIAGSSLKPPGGRYKGQITAETATELKMTINGKEQSVPVDQIEAVEYTGPPQAYSVGVVREQSNNLTDALDQYQKAIAASGDRPLMGARPSSLGRGCWLKCRWPTPSA